MEQQAEDFYAVIKYPLELLKPLTNIVIHGE